MKFSVWVVTKAAITVGLSAKDTDSEITGLKAAKTTLVSFTVIVSLIATLYPPIIADPTVIASDMGAANVGNPVSKSAAVMASNTVCGEATLFAISISTGDIASITA